MDSRVSNVTNVMMAIIRQVQMENHLLVQSVTTSARHVLVLLTLALNVPMVIMSLLPILWNAASAMTSV